jgi:DNA-binding IscR family transcriptional regulator
MAPVQCLGASPGDACPECTDKKTCGIRLVMTDVQEAMSSVLDKVTLADMLQRSEFERQKLSQQLDYAI